MKYELAIFDMDGTVLYTLEDLKSSLNYALTSCGFPERSLDEVRRFVGNGIRRLVERGVPKGSADADIDAVFEKFNTHYAVHCADSTKPYDGIPKMLKALRERGIKTAVASNKADYAVQALVKRYFRGLFDFAVGAKDGVQKKPAPDCVLEAISRLSASAEKTVYIGDSEVDIETAKNAGVDCIAVDWGFRERTELVAAGAPLIVSDTAALLRGIVSEIHR